MTTTPTPSAQEATMLQFAFMLAPISGMTLTAWTVETPEGTAFVPFTRVTPLVPATPLVVFV